MRLPRIQDSGVRTQGSRVGGADKKDAPEKKKLAKKRAYGKGLPARSASKGTAAWPLLALRAGNLLSAPPEESQLGQVALQVRCLFGVKRQEGQTWRAAIQV